MPKSKKTIERQRALYQLFIKESFETHKVLTQEDICKALPNYYKLTNRPHTSDKCPKIWSDINAINQDPETDIIIITKKYRYWIGTREETIEYKRSYWNNEVAPRLVRYWNFVRKFRKDGQGFFDNDDELKFHDAFNSYDGKMNTKES